MIAPELGIAAIEDATKFVIDALGEMGIRKDCMVLVGGGPLNARSARSVGADVYCPDALVALKTATALKATRRG